MEIKNVKNKLLDKLNIERVMTEEEVKEELELVRLKKVIVGLSIGCGTLAIIKYSGTVDEMAFRLIDTIKSYMKSNTMFLGGLPIPNWFIYIIFQHDYFNVLCIYK